MSTGGVQLVPMKQLAEARSKDDDWTGMTDMAARKKRQCRLSKRLQRRRKQTEKLAGPSVNSPNDLVWWRKDTCQMDTPLEFRTCETSTYSPASKLAYSSSPLFNAESAPTQLWFPLTVDNLLTLIEFNVYRAFLTNMSILSLSQTMSVWKQVEQMFLPSPYEFPPSLTPTPLQLQIPHPEWMDIFPLANLRHNLISHQGTYDEKDLCIDMLGGLFYGRCDNERRGMIVWMDPWDVNAWEVTDGFVKKWGFLLQGCRELLESTNKWREFRGEESLLVEF